MKHDIVYNKINNTRPGVLALFDPDRISTDQISACTQLVCDQGVAGILIGTSVLISPDFDDFVHRVKEKSSVPIIIFPGGSHQICSHADAIFFLSLLSGRNAEYLIGEQVKAVYLIKKSNLEVIPVGYILVESGSYTAVEYVSGTKPIPRLKSEIAVAHALAGQYFGMKYIYLEAGSGAAKSVPTQMVDNVKQILSIPLIVGGGIRAADQAKALFDAGADFVVLGSIIEKAPDQFKRIMQGLQ